MISGANADVQVWINAPNELENVLVNILLCSCLFTSAHLALWFGFIEAVQLELNCSEDKIRALKNYVIVGARFTDIFGWQMQAILMKAGLVESDEKPSEFFDLASCVGKLVANKLNVSHTVG